MSFSLINMGEDAIDNFTEQLQQGIKDSIWCNVAIIAILLITLLITVADCLCFERYKLRFTVINLIAAFIVHTSCVMLLGIGGTGAYTVYDVYYSTDSSTDATVQNLGLITTTRLEAQHTIFKKHYAQKSIKKASLVIEERDYSQAEYNVLNIDFKEIVDNCDSLDAAHLAAQLSRIEPTKKNEYTGIFKNHNLITICAESFSPYIIDKKRTPTLYRLANEGFIFNNFYASYDAVTTNGEYTYCLGMFPDLSRSKKNNSFIASAENELPFALGNQFKSIGADTYAYHNFLGTYYSRNITHPNMGYDTFKTPENGLDIAPTWPSSDYDMMVESVGDYINSEKQFHAYYMTFSGHYQYNWANIMCLRNRTAVKHLNYPTTVKAYLSCNLELEKALTYLLDELEKAKIADKTVIVLTTDHYPYGLDENNYNVLSGKQIDTVFEKYRNSFICWSGSIKQAVNVNEICSTIDILPTLLNLFGFEYDSRLIMGRDILAEGENTAILANQSFICSDYRFNAKTNELILTTDREISDIEIESKKSYIKSILNLSRTILNTNFYQYITED
ncbi:MAG: LTA synthase family protein [Clostridia bacterium]|nr:LTA synthase family protein [Clostridia bacterium]